MKLSPLNAPGAAQPAGGCAQAMEVHAAQRWLFVSGQIPEDAHGNVPTDFRAQARQVWANLQAQLQAAGMSMANLVKVTTFLSSREYADINSEVRRATLGSHTPALTVVVAGIFDPRWLLEIEAVAAA